MTAWNVTNFRNLYKRGGASNSALAETLNLSRCSRFIFILLCTNQGTALGCTDRNNKIYGNVFINLKVNLTSVSFTDL
jgi:hypothetical protein